MAEAGSETFFGFMGVVCGIVFANLGAAFGTTKSGVGISSLEVLKPYLIIKSVIPVVMADILGIYSLNVSVMLIQKIDATGYTYYKGFAYLASGLCCGLSSSVSIFLMFRLLD